MFKHAVLTISHRVPLLAVFLAASVAFPAAQSGQSSQNAAKPAVSADKPAGAPFRNEPNRLPQRVVLYYQSIWGVDSLTVKWSESGEIVRFSYRVVDPAKAAPLNDKKNEPSLIDPRAGVKLVVPVMEKIGALRQSAKPEEGKTYWMAFSNQGRRVKRGDHVDVVIGSFRAEGLVVD